MEENQKVKEEGMLVPSNEYFSAGVHIGTKNKTKYMEKYIFKVRPDGLAILDIQKVDERLKLVINYLSKYEPDEILIVCKKENGKKPLKLLNAATGIKVMVGRYIPGMLTNVQYKDFIEPKVVLITDKWHDKQALKDALKSDAVIIAMCNSHDTTNNIDIALPCNNRGQKSLALLYYLIAKGYAKARGMPFEYKKEQFM